MPMVSQMTFVEKIREILNLETKSGIKRSQRRLSIDRNLPLLAIKAFSLQKKSNLDYLMLVYEIQCCMLAKQG